MPPAAALRIAALVALALAASGCGQPGGPRCDQYGSCAVAPTVSATASATSTALPSASSSSGGPCPTYCSASGPDTCTRQTPCAVPAFDAGAAVAIVVNASYHPGEVAHVRLRDDGNVTYRYPATQASCELGIYDDWGRRLGQGVCSDAVFGGDVAPGQEAAYWDWSLGECDGGGPWYGGCDHVQPEPPGLYHLRETFCPATRGTESTGPQDGCSRSGADLRIA